MPEPIIIRLRKDIPKKGSPEYSLISGCEHILMPQVGTYALGANALRDACENDSDSIQPLFTLDDGSSIIRPLTFRENIEARVNDYNTLHSPDGSERAREERLRLFSSWLDSCTGIAYKAGTSQFKIIGECSQLITIQRDFNQAYLPVQYDGINGIELYSNDSIYNTSLTKPQAENHSGWLAAVGGDNALLSEYADIVFRLLEEKYKRRDGMAFCVRKNTEADELRALFVDNINYVSIAGGNYGLYYGGSFLRVAPSQNFSTGSEGK